MSGAPFGSPAACRTDSPDVTSQLQEPRADGRGGGLSTLATEGRSVHAVHEEFVVAARDMATWSQPEIGSVLARRVLSPGKDGITVRKLMVDDTEISWLPPTAANLSQLTAAVPSGFRKLPYPPPWCVRC